MSRFFLNALHERRYPLCAVGYLRTRGHLLSWRPVLPPRVKEAAVRVSRVGQEAAISPHSGAWLFLYENVPQLRYHNPSIKFSFEAHQDKDSMLTFTLDDGEKLSLVTTRLRQKEIQNQIEDFIENVTLR